MSSIKCAALDRINEFTREYCPITYTYSISINIFENSAFIWKSGIRETEIIWSIIFKCYIVEKSKEWVH